MALPIHLPRGGVNTPSNSFTWQDPAKPVGQCALDYMTSSTAPPRQLHLARPYSTSSTFTWSTSGRLTGVYRFSVWAKDAASAGVQGTAPYTYDSFSAFAYSLSVGSCTGVTAVATPATTSSVGGSVSLTAAAVGCASPLYAVWRQSPAGAWSLVRAYASANSYAWNTSLMAPGAYRFSVWVKGVSSPGIAGTAPYSHDSFVAFPYTLTSSPCASVGVTTSAALTAPVGTNVSVSATAACPRPLYQFFVLPPGGVWTLAQGYSTAATLSWKTAGKTAGSYRFSVWTRDASGKGTQGTAPYTYDAFSTLVYTLS